MWWMGFSHCLSSMRLDGLWNGEIGRYRTGRILYTLWALSRKQIHSKIVYNSEISAKIPLTNFTSRITSFSQIIWVDCWELLWWVKSISRHKFHASKLCSNKKESKIFVSSITVKMCSNHLSYVRIDRDWEATPFLLITSLVFPWIRFQSRNFWGTLV